MDEEEGARYEIITALARIGAKIECLMKELEKGGVLTQVQLQEIEAGSAKCFEKHLDRYAQRVGRLGVKRSRASGE
jgi:hypothetical protein